MTLIEILAIVNILEKKTSMGKEIQEWLTLVDDIN